MIDEKKILQQIADFKRAQKSENCDYLTGYISALSVVEGMIADLPKVGEWIPVSERLPEKKQNVLAWRGGHIGGMMDVYCYLGKGVWEDSYGYFQDTYEEGITAWMPLPESYKGE